MADFLKVVDEAVKSPLDVHLLRHRKECTLTANAFMRRYLQHVLPPGQHRVRYFGWMHPAAGARRMKVATLLAVVVVVLQKADAPAWHLCCPHCHAFTLVRIGRLAPDDMPLAKALCSSADSLLPAGRAELARASKDLRSIVIRPSPPPSCYRHF